MSETPRIALAQRNHRPWPLPPGDWLLRQRWRHLLIAHWPVPVDTVRQLIPRDLEVDTFEGRTWAGVVPFLMDDTAPRHLPAVPCLSRFPELNLRLYVCHGDRPGVWFLSLDAANPVAVQVARAGFHLPYFNASMHCRPGPDGWIDYRSRRRRDPAGLAFQARYRPVEEIVRARRGSLEEWLTERYCLYATRPDGTLLRGEIHHSPWPLQRAEAEIDCNELGIPWGLDLVGEPRLHYAREVAVVAWKPVAVDGVDS